MGLEFRAQASLHPVSCILYLVSCILYLVSSATADLDMQIQPGFDGYHKHDRWLPLKITLASVGEDMTGEVAVEMQDRATGTRQVYSTPIVLSNQRGSIRGEAESPRPWLRGARRADPRFGDPGQPTRASGQQMKGLSRFHSWGLTCLG